VSNKYYKPSGYGGFSFLPPVIKYLIIINVIVFIIELMGKQIAIGYNITVYDVLIRYFSLMPLGYGFQIWQLITYQFIHGGFWHIAINMFVLWMFGIEVENLWGTKKFIIFYLMCGVVAGIAQLFLPPLIGEPLAPTIGASGAIFGVLIAFGMLFPDRYIYLYFFIPVKAKYLIAFFVLLEFFSIDSPGSNVAHLAHLGGALAGFVYIMLDPSVNVSLKNILRRRAYKRGGTVHNPFNKVSELFKKKDDNIQEVNFYEIKDKNKDKDTSKITQEEIDRILDKISQSGYQNLTEEEKKILFEASKKMK